ncbi:MAG: sigma-70 family RNA polymerase sigma factor [Planctomycetia bacterium]|nr:sigma-70 family RNA polymerase sigma factor [Planctomycetia bacterium]
MLIEQKSVQCKLRAIARKLGARLTLAEDLYQEMLLHVWQQELRRPGQKEAWYVNGCAMHARNYLRRGRSVDSNGRRTMRAEGVAPADIPAPEPVTEHAYEAQYASEFLNVLAEKLSGVKRHILVSLAKGQSEREVAGTLGISQPAVSKHFKAIKAEAWRLESAMEAVRH